MSQTRDRHILTPAEYENIVKRHVADAEGVTEDDTSLAHIQKQANAIRGLGQQAALNRLVRSLQRAEQWQKDKLANQVREAKDQINELNEQIKNIPPHMELAAGFEWGKDLGGSDETIISQLHDRPVFVHRYPKQAKAFYMKPDSANSQVVLNFDCLAPQGYGEIIGGSMREDDYDALLARIHQMGFDQADYEWYLDLRHYGSVPHGGFGLGVERTVAWLAGIKHIRETIAYPRMMGKIYP